MEQDHKTTEEKIRELGETTTAPLLFPFVRWVLSDCRKRGIKRIYFLARDGYILKKIAEKICEGREEQFDFRYLYCSRYSLRLPLYHLIGDEGMEQITCSAAENSAKAVFSRVGFSDEEMRLVMNEISAEFSPEMELNKTEFNEFCGKLKRCETFKNMVYEKSENAFDSAVSYFRQEGLFDEEKYAIVDSGWSGSMQRSLRQLLEFSGCKKHLVGFYFGMFTRPISEEDGEYYTFYFSAETKKSVRLKFCNNLFECWLAAPHGMTIGYEEKNGKFVPVFQDEPPEKQLKIVREHQDGILKFTGTSNLENFDFLSEWKFVRKRIARVMTKPSADEAESYGALMFSDDVSGTNEIALASKDQIAKLKSYSIPRRFFRRFHGRGNFTGANLFWAYGTIAFAPAIKRPWYRMNVYVWEWLRLTLKK